jgi:putative salt-induced outer membrane protein
VLNQFSRILIFCSIFFLNSALAQFSNETSLTSVVVGGNSVQNTFNVKSLNAYKKDMNTYKVGGAYTYGKADGTLNTRRWDANTRYDRELGVKSATFANIQREQDYFANLEYRWNYDIGASYLFIKDKKQEFKGEGGYRRTLESDFEGRKISGTKARLYTEYSRKQNENLFFKLWVEGLPNFSIKDDWQVNFEPSANVTVSSFMSLKLAYLHRYDNQPLSGAKKSDYTYTTSLIARF